MWVHIYKHYFFDLNSDFKFLSSISYLLIILTNLFIYILLQSSFTLYALKLNNISELKNKIYIHILIFFNNFYYL